MQYVGNITAVGGAEINLNGVGLASGVFLNAAPDYLDQEPGGIVDLASVTEIDDSYLYATEGGIIHLSPTNVSLVNSSLYVSSNGTVLVGSLEVLSGSVLYGPGSISGSVLNEGDVSFDIDIGTLNVSGDYQQTAGATLTVRLEGSSGVLSSDEIVCGSAQLDGTLNVNAVDYGYVPQAGDSFTILTAGSVSGTFANVILPPLLGDLIFVVNYDAGDVTLTVEHGSPLLVSADADPGNARAALLTTSQLQPLVTEAVARWQALGIDQQQAEFLDHLQVRIADLPPEYLGLESGDVVWIDQNAAGYGWFVDPTPAGNEEFTADAGRNELVADQDSAAAGRIDLLTVVLHEFGHALGLVDQSDTGGTNSGGSNLGSVDLMGARLAPSVRELPSAADVQLVSSQDSHPAGRNRCHFETVAKKLGSG